MVSCNCVRIQRARHRVFARSNGRNVPFLSVSPEFRLTARALAGNVNVMMLHTATLYSDTRRLQALTLF